MDDRKTFEFYEKLYFHEIEMRDRISGRLQIPLAIILSFAGAYAYLIRDVSFEYMSCWHIVFLIIFIIGFFLFIVSAMFFVWVFSWDRYNLMPPTTELEEHRKALIANNSQSNNSEKFTSESFSESLFDFYEKYSSLNAKINDKRSERLHIINMLSAVNFFLLILAFLIFTFSDIKEVGKISVTNPVKVEVLEKPLQLIPK